MSSINLQRVSSGKSINKRVRKISRTDSEVACEEAARLTAELQEEAGSPEDEDSCEYHDMPPPPDGGYGWVIVFASFMCNMIVDGIAYTFGVFLGEFVTYFKEGKGKVAWVGSLLSGVYLSAGPIVSALANKYGCRTVCIAGSIIACTAFVLSTFSTSVTMLMLTYGVMGGFGFGLIYLPAVVAVGYYFETKRSLATGIAVCGSGFGTFAFAPLATFLLEYMDWKNANFILAGLILNCAVFGALMRPLEYPKKKKMKPLMQRMYEEKRLQLERGSIGGSYFMVQLPDGTMEKRMKLPLNTEPGVHSSLALDQMAAQAQGGLHPVATLPTITESKVTDHKEEMEQREAESKPKRRPHRVSESDGSAVEGTTAKNMPRNASQPAFSTQSQGIPKNGSVPTFDRIRKTSQGERFKPSLAAIKASSRGNMGSNNGEVRKNTQLKLSSNSVTGSRPNNTDDSDGEMVYTSKTSLPRERPAIVRPMSRKDIFYSGSVTNLREYQSQKSLSHYRNSVISLPRYEKVSRMDVRDGGDDVERGEKYDLCPCLVLPDSFKSALATMLDVSLLKDPVFMMIGISNVFGMAGLYVPFVYLVDAAILSGISQNSASFLLSIIGITNTFGRVICGYVADFPKVDSLLLNNMCLVVSTIAVSLTPFCSSYGAYVAMAIFFGVAVSGYISLTSIILVDLLGLDKLTNAFGLLILFRGAAAIVGSPLAGAVYDSTQSYDIPFYMAGFFFLISTITSFMAPAMKRFSKAGNVQQYPEEALTPIDEEPAEDLADDDQPITMVPKIVHTAPSPSTEQPQGFKATDDKEVNQRESVL
ncbi:monocarboxylate transporter 14 isoform X2 [Lutzomyia longipalpis]|uniref:monocarboxylate transporter 14 isoform X2 n=1 Tax=Lutzomyia longipalpis TaxID=7200 RepID=UPI0024841EC8|nr:monocarboxylate transporter 14 isoform X2 [Lutzomyia longipalpis]XP_055694059.1 monocarboxylate transporter 14 isoform X2 [Lutzomyia longipalpis]XP_055694060.1 monocarboxylate transporter 14 isoform X2 [Lutzomyia longipalpis]XP_055694061.1 monocarboxylate transporter 14 isoform X2 [Lutzomyia longipalpis]